MGDRNAIIDIIVAAYNAGHNDTVEGYQRDPAEFAGELVAEMWDGSKPRRDPLTDPRPGDVVRFRESAHPEYGFTVAEISHRFLDVVTIAYTGDHDPERMAVDAWSDWSEFTVEVLHTADEVPNA